MNLQTARTCSRKAALNENLSSAKNKFFTLSKVVSESITLTNVNDTLDIITKNVKDSVSKIDTDGFNHEFELNANMESIINGINRYLKWERNQGGKFVKKNITGEITIPTRTEKISMTANLLIDKGGHYHLVKFFRGRPSMTYGGRTIDTSPVDNAELYCLQLLGESLNLDKPFLPSFYYLKAKSDKKGRFIEEFEYKKGENIIQYYFNNEEKVSLANALKDVKYDINDRVNCENCSDCTYNDLCNTQFIARSFPEEKEEDSTYRAVNVTKEQEQLILAREGNYCVNAVAGSGKTSVIALRTLSLLEEEQKPENILMITFTDKARQEMLNKIKGYEGVFYDGWGFDVEKINIETFNSWGHKIINNNFSVLGFTNPPQIIEDLTKRDIIIDLLSKNPELPLNYEYPFMDLPFVKGAVLEMAQIIDKLKAENVQSSDDVKNTLSIPEAKENKWHNTQDIIFNIYTEYNQELKKRNKVDYEDQLRLLTELKAFKVLDRLPYEHIIIDEFQDSNSNQLSIIEDMLKCNKNIKSLVVVGDTMQAIYSFRNTSPENLLNFGKKFAGTVNIDLTQNFRSDKGVVDWANRIIKKESNEPKYMRAFNAKQYEPKLEIFEKDNEAETMVVNQVKEWLLNGVDLSDIAVLARSKSELIRYQKLLVESGFDAVLKVPEIVKDNPFVKGIFALSNYLYNTEDIKGLSLYAKSKDIDPFNKNDVLTLGEKLKANILNQNLEEEKINALFAELTTISSLDYTAKYFIDKLIALKAKTLNEILTYIRKYDMYEVKDAYSVDIGDTNAITLITVHSSKGLEYPNVVLLLDKFKDTAEEKRLLYVGVTRAKKELTVLIKKKQKELISLLSDAS